MPKLAASHTAQFTIASRSSRPTVLACEDEVLVRMLMVNLLDESGFRTFEVSVAEEAIALLEARPDIHVLLPM